METKDLEAWQDFEQELARLEEEHSRLKASAPSEPSKYLFRGQPNHKWDLKTTLERHISRDLTLEEYYHFVLAAKPQIDTLTNRRWEIPNFPQLVEWTHDYHRLKKETLPGYDFLIYIRHHGFPSPLLDWTASPYVAAFFAFRSTNAKRVAIYAFLESTGQGKTGSSGTPTIVCPGPYVRSHSRHFLQQSQYTICCRYNKKQWKLCKHRTVLDPKNPPVSESARQDISWKFTLPASERLSVLKILDKYNLNSYSLFQSEEALLETMAFREIECREAER
jgi:hypothetical protein